MKNAQMGSQAYVPPDFEASGSSNAPLAGGGAGFSGTGERRPRTGGIFSFDYYAWYFDVDSNDVARRCLFAINPLNKTPFLEQEDTFGGQLESGRSGLVAGGNPDLYGPFWICTTVVFVLFFASSLMGMLFSSWQGVKYEYQFDLLTGAAGLMFGYTFVVPVVLWLVIRYLDISPATTVLQLICLYGYSNITWIPIAILSISPLVGTPTLSNIIRWVFIGLGFVVSGSFLAKNIYKTIVPSLDHSQSLTVNKRPALFVLVGVLAMHVGLAIGIKFLFFAGIKINK
jgi:hypothetical protein